MPRFDGVRRLRVFIRGVEFLKIIYVYLQKSNISEEGIGNPPRARTQNGSARVWSHLVYLHKNTPLHKNVSAILTWNGIRGKGTFGINVAR